MTASHAGQLPRTGAPGTASEQEARVADELGRHADFHAWSQAATVADICQVATGGRNEADRIITDAAARSGMERTVLSRRVHAIEFLRNSGLEHVIARRVIPLGIVTMIVGSPHVDLASKVEWVEQLYAEQCASPVVGLRDMVKRRLDTARATALAGSNWRRAGDRWDFRSFDPRLGRDGQVGRLPGQAALNLVDRFLVQGGRVVAACCGSGTVLDACKILGVANFVGFDLRCDSRVAERHARNFLKFDAVQANWDPVCSRAAADLIILTPPQHTFGRSAETDSPTDLGAVVDPDEWVAGIGGMLEGATSALAVGGVLAVTVRATAEFENGTPVPDLRAAVGRVLDSLGYEVFLANPVISVGRSRARTHDGAWLVPEVVQVVVMRKT